MVSKKGKYKWVFIWRTPLNSEMRKIKDLIYIDEMETDWAKRGFRHFGRKRPFLQNSFFQNRTLTFRKLWSLTEEGGSGTYKQDVYAYSTFHIRAAHRALHEGLTYTDPS
jgi:hypothetical protein